ncbi:hypothetical protein D3C71_915850 [compost metagenome]
MIALSIALSKPLPIHRDMRQRPETETETGRQKQKQKKETETLRAPLRGGALEKGRLKRGRYPATPCKHEESMSRLNFIKINQRAAEPPFLDPALTKSGFPLGADGQKISTSQGSCGSFAAKAVKKDRSADHGRN